MDSPAKQLGAPQGLVGYAVTVSVPGEERVFQFTVTGASAIPRIGEGMDFNGPEKDNLTLLVTDVRHGFSGPGDWPPQLQVTVDTVLSHDAERDELETARNLLEPAALRRWTSHFTMLTPTGMDFEP